MSKKCHKTSIGGQALIEGLMMRGPNDAATAIRLPNGEIEVKHHEENRLQDSHKWAKWPLVRGTIAFFESLKFGYRYLDYSAEKSMEDDGTVCEEEPSKLDQWMEAHLTEGVINALMIIAVILGVALALVLFMWLPAFLVDMFDKYITHDVLETHNLHPLFEGILKIIILILYMAGVRRMNEIKRVFQYHGAEHKTIACYENGLELTVENVRAQTRFHPRCGTSFTIVMLLISILFSTILVLVFPGIGTIRWLWVLVKILIIPLIMGFGYEFIRYAGRHDNLLANILSQPGLWMQRITTIEPEDSMIECGIAAFLAVLPEDPETAEIQ